MAKFYKMVGTSEVNLIKASLSFIFSKTNPNPSPKLYLIYKWGTLSMSFFKITARMLFI